jgi:threonine aldolase
VPAQVTLTIDEAKGVIKEAGGDVIQVGFLASAYRRNLEEDPESRETIASRKRLCELVGKRLKDRGLLASDGILELRD